MAPDPRQIELQARAADAVAAAAEKGERVPARLRATPARGRASAAVFMVFAVARAFLMASIACVRAQRKRRALDVIVRTRTPRAQRRRHAAHIRAIEIQANALAQMHDIKFRNACIRA